MSDDLTIPDPAYRGNRAGRYGTGQTRVQPSMDPDTRRLMLFAGGLGAILSILIGTSAVIGHRSKDVPVITADTRPIRIKPENPGGMKIDGAENEVFSGGADNKNARLAAAAENPNTTALTAADVPPSPAPAARTAETPSQTFVPAAPTAVAPVAPKPAVVAILPPPVKPAVITKAPALPAAKPAAAAVETHPAATGHQAVVQLAALTTEEAAHNEWQQLVKRMPDVLNGHQPAYSRIEREGRVFWRVRTAGFADVAQARGFCDHVRAKGGGCSVADF